jgi:hypothetical protein
MGPVAGVYLVYRHQLFADAVRAILATRPEIRLVGASDRQDVDAAELLALAPGVVLVEDGDDGPALGDVQRILTSPTTFRLITLRMDHDDMHVWSGRWQQSTYGRDLVEAIITAGENAL